MIWAWRDFSAFSSRNHHFSEKHEKSAAAWWWTGGETWDFVIWRGVDWLEIHGFFVENGERVRKNMVNEREKYCLCRELDPEIRFE